MANIEVPTPIKIPKVSCENNKLGILDNPLELSKVMPIVKTTVKHYKTKSHCTNFFSYSVIRKLNFK